MSANSQQDDHMEEDAGTSQDSAYKISYEELEVAEIICVIGAPGVGKGTQCKKLKTDIKAVHVSVGDLLRDKAANLKEFYEIDLDEYMRKSMLVPKEITQAYLEGHIIDHVTKGNRRFLVDGFPRSPDQALYARERGFNIKAVLCFKSTKEKALSRMRNRANTAEVARVDDTDEIFEERYKGFMEKLQDIQGYYEQRNIFHEVDCEGDLQEIYEQLVKQVEILGKSSRSIATGLNSQVD